MGFEDAALKSTTEPPLFVEAPDRRPTASPPVPRLSTAKQVIATGSHQHIEAVSRFQTTSPSFLPFIEPTSKTSQTMNHVVDEEDVYLYEHLIT